MRMTEAQLVPFWCRRGRLQVIVTIRDLRSRILAVGGISDSLVADCDDRVFPYLIAKSCLQAQKPLRVKVTFITCLIVDEEHQAVGMIDGGRSITHQNSSPLFWSI